MIRTFLASQWVPLFYWCAGLVALAFSGHHGPKKIEGPTQREGSLETSKQYGRPPWIPASIIAPYMPLPEYVVGLPPAPIKKVFVTDQETREKELPTRRSPTMLSLYAGSEETSAQEIKHLQIPCRTFTAVSNSHGSHPVIYGVVTQDVASGAGSILIQAGSKVVGRANIDSENGRLKSDSVWSLYVDNTEIKAKAQIKDANAGMAGVVGEEMSSEDEVLQRQAIVRDGRYVYVPEKTSFTLEIQSDFSVQELKESTAAANN
jgi:hypothetical protein